MNKQLWHIQGTVQQVLIAANPLSSISTPVEKIQVIVGHGVKHDKHAGPRLLDVRETDLLAAGFIRGDEICNQRQFSAICAQETNGIATDMGIPEIPPGLLGENLIFDSIPSFSQLPIGAKIFFQKPHSYMRSAVLIVSGPNNPCKIPADNIQSAYPDVSGLSKKFGCAVGRRGIVGSIYKSGYIHGGDIALIVLPPPPTYPYPDTYSTN